MNLVLKQQYMKAIYKRYHESGKKEKKSILDEFSNVCGYHRKHAIRKINQPLCEESQNKRRGRYKYDARVISIIEQVWESSGYLWSVRLKEAIKIWMPHIRERFKTTSETEHQLLSISAPQIDRRLNNKKLRLRKRIYGTTKPGSLLKRYIEVRTSNWDLKEPGWLENDLVAHSGSNASGDFANTLNTTDIASTWVARRALLGKSQVAVRNAMDDIVNSLPFTTKGIDSDNGSEFINGLLTKYCADKKIVFTRSREYKKDDNAHIEQKNFTHVRKMIGYARYDTMEAVNAMNDLYRNELDLFQNLFQPSVKLKEKIRIGSRIKRVYDEAMTPLDRLFKLGNYNKAKVESLIRLREKLNPFDLSEAVERKIEKIYALANRSVRAAFCPKNVYRPKLVRSLLKPDEHMGTGIGMTKVFSDDVLKIKKTYLKEVMLQTR